jgi:hypothetical protein
MKMKKRVTLCLSIAVFALLFSLIFIKGHHEPKTSNSAASKSEISTTVSDKMSVNQLANKNYTGYQDFVKGCHGPNKRLLSRIETETRGYVPCGYSRCTALVKISVPNIFLLPNSRK